MQLGTPFIHLKQNALTGLTCAYIMQALEGSYEARNNTG